MIHPARHPPPSIGAKWRERGCAVVALPTYVQCMQDDESHTSKQARLVKHRAASTKVAALDDR